MSTNLKHALVFVAGAAAGSAATWVYFKNKYEKLAQEEIASVKEALSRSKTESEPPKQEPEVEPEKIPDEDIPKKDLMSYATEIAKNGYTNYSDSSAATPKQEEDTVEKPYIIAPEDFGEFHDYEKISLTHYADGVLTDENDEIVDNVDETVGSDYADHIGDYEPDAVHIRNDRLRYDYEILRDLRNYSDVIG